MRVIGLDVGEKRIGVARVDSGTRIAVPVGFVHVEESKERIFSACERAKVSCIAAMGRKGGSSIAAAVCNCLLYTAAGMEDPAARGWS